MSRLVEQTISKELSYENLYIKGQFYSFDNINRPPLFEKKYAIDIHNHKDLEIIYMKTGRMYFTANNTSFELCGGDMAIFNPYDTHEAYYLRTEPLVEYYYIRVDFKALITSPINSINQLIYRIESQTIRFPNKIAADSPQNEELKNAFLMIFNAYDARKRALPDNDIVSEARLYASIFSILPTLSAIANSFEVTPLGEKEIKFIKDVAKYMSRHYAEPITINGMCNALSYSKSSLYRMFETCFNESPSIYIRNYRVLKAATEFVNSDMAISEIALAVGFSDYCYFSKSFKSRIGISPKKFFIQLKNKT